MEGSKKSSSFLAKMLAIAIPVSLQGLVSSLVNTLDTLMISSLGSSTIAGVGLANQIFFFFMLICFGIHTGTSVLLSQYWGRKDLKGLAYSFQISLVFSVCIAILFSFASGFFSRPIIGLMSPDSHVVGQGSAYLGVIAWTYLLTALSLCIGNGLRATGLPRAPLVGSLLSFVANAFFNYVFIFGHLGFPRLGVIGAGLGTLIARILELAYLISVLARSSGPIRLSWMKIGPIPTTYWTLFLVTALPVILNEAFWSLGQVFYNIAYARAGTGQAAAVQVANSILGLVNVFIRGIAAAASIMIGQSIGKGYLQRAAKDAWTFIGLSLGQGSLIALLLFAFPTFFLSFFASLDSQVAAMALEVLRAMALLLILKSINAVVVVGVLRGGGDTTYSMYIETACVWLVGVPLAWLGAVVWHLPIWAVVLCAGMEEAVKCGIGLWRVKSKKWIHQLPVG